MGAIIIINNIIIIIIIIINFILINLHSPQGLECTGDAASLMHFLYCWQEPNSFLSLGELSPHQQSTAATALHSDENRAQ